MPALEHGWQLGGGDGLSHRTEEVASGGQQVCAQPLRDGRVHASLHHAALLARLHVIVLALAHRHLDARQVLLRQPHAHLVRVLQRRLRLAQARALAAIRLAAHVLAC